MLLRWLRERDTRLAATVSGGYHYGASLLQSAQRAAGKRRRIYILGVLVLAVLGVLCWYTYELNAHQTAHSDSLSGGLSQGKEERRYGVVIDAGSSGSRLMIYTWNTAAFNNLEASNSSSSSDKWKLPEIERAGEQWTVKTEPGISSFSNRPSFVGKEHLKQLLDFAHQQIPQDQHIHTQVLLLATAGMRLLSRTQQEQILAHACSYARSNYNFALREGCTGSFQVVSGEREGLFGWTAANYLLNPQFRTNDTLGFLDMGGASAQIAFVPNTHTPDKNVAKDLATVTLRSIGGADRTFGVFVATFLGHGTNEARRRYVQKLLEHSTTQSHQLENQLIDDPCLALDLALPTTNGRALLRGQGDFKACVLATEPLLNRTACIESPCLFAGKPAPTIDFTRQKFVGVSEFWYATHDHLQLGGLWDVELFENRASEFCQTPWPQLLDSRARGSTDELLVGRLQMQCFKAAWIVNVLHAGFGMPRTSASFRSVHHVEGTEVSWTLGALLLQVMQTIPASSSLSSPGIRLPVLAGTDNGLNPDAVDLIDDSLWSPLQFVGLKRLLVIWSTQPPYKRMLIAAAIMLVILTICGPLFWLCARLVCLPKWRIHQRRKHSGIFSSYSPAMAASPTQMASFGEMHLETENSFAMRPVGDELTQRAASLLPQPHPSWPLDNQSSTERTRNSTLPLNSAVFTEESPISRSSSVSNLPMLNRRRGC
ncbi:Golgi apyrase [Coemansia brasiliensis]|uniref:Golgi apyrase n=1 Tax=Coemansia brasiliensis TaxID=2650707 RepID=A0A9W8I902_9FUNG|nr:Golgi apyrase [Coemansia brasiliensis]